MIEYLAHNQWAINLITCIPLLMVGVWLHIGSRRLDRKSKATMERIRTLDIKIAKQRARIAEGLTIRYEMAKRMDAERNGRNT